MQWMCPYTSNCISLQMFLFVISMRWKIKNIHTNWFRHNFRNICHKSSKCQRGHIIYNECTCSECAKSDCSVTEVCNPILERRKKHNYWFRQYFLTIVINWASICQRGHTYILCAHLVNVATAKSNCICLQMFLFVIQFYKKNQYLLIHIIFPQTFVINWASICPNPAGGVYFEMICWKVNCFKFTAFLEVSVFLVDFALRLPFPEIERNWWTILNNSNIFFYQIEGFSFNQIFLSEIFTSGRNLISSSRLR